MKALAGALLAVAICPGCALWKDPVPPAFERIAVRAEVESNDEGELDGDLRADTTIKGVLIGGGAGAVAGAGIGIWAGLACGLPAAVVCLPVFTIFGGTVGGLAGGVFGGIGGLSRDTATQVSAILTDLQGSRDFTRELRTVVSAALPREKQVEEDRAEAIVTARLDEVDLRQHRGDRLSLRMRASLIQEWDRDSEDPKTNTCEYEFTTPKLDVEEWLLDDGKAFGAAFTDSIDTLARWMARDLEAFSTRTAQPATDDAPETCFQE